MLARQTELVSPTEGGITKTVCWLEVDKRLSPGVIVTLQGDDTLWTITSQSEAQEVAGIHTDWNVGGLSDTKKKQLLK